MHSAFTTRGPHAPLPTHRIGFFFSQDRICEEFRSYGERHGGPLAHVERFEQTTSLHNWSHRQWEIGEWLKSDAGRGASDWLALDDEELLEGEAMLELRPMFEGHVVACESHIGLTASLADLGISLLAQQRQRRSRAGAGRFEQHQQCEECPKAADDGQLPTR